jgi:pimeloyl-ACP methyl ester carboxylesterase
MSPRQFLVERRERRIEAFEYGEGDETVILAAGNARPAAQLDRLATDLASAGFRAITYNYRGIGNSTGPIDGLSLHDFADDVWALADDVEASRVHLVGKTYGNRVMRTAASDQPARCASLVLVGAGGLIPPSDETQAMYRRYLDPSISTQEWTELNAALMYAPGHEHLSAAAADLGSFPDVARAQIEASNATPTDDWSMGGSSPMLIIVGLQDRVAVPANGLAIATERPNSWLVGLPDCAHNMIDEQPDVLSRLIADFLDGNLG